MLSLKLHFSPSFVVFLLWFSSSLFLLTPLLFFHIFRSIILPSIFFFLIIITLFVLFDNIIAHFCCQIQYYFTLRCFIVSSRIARSLVPNCHYLMFLSSSTFRYRCFHCRRLSSDSFVASVWLMKSIRCYSSRNHSLQYN